MSMSVLADANARVGLPRGPAPSAPSMLRPVASWNPRERDGGRCIGLTDNV
jgi:hypothetical protein